MRAATCRNRGTVGDLGTKSTPMEGGWRERERESMGCALIPSRSPRTNKKNRLTGLAGVESKGGKESVTTDEQLTLTPTLTPTLTLTPTARLEN